VTLTTQAGRQTLDRVRLAVSLAAAMLIGLNMRPAITSVATLLDVIAAEQLGDWQTVVLSSLPIAAFGVTAPFIPWVARKLGVAFTLFVAMVVLFVALLVRSGVDGMLLPATGVASVAIMFGSVLVPPFLRSLAATPFWVGITTTMFGLGAALGAWIAIPVYDRAGSNLAAALGFWAWPALAAAVAMLVVMVGFRQNAESRTVSATQATGQGTGWHLNLAVVGTFSLMAMVYATVIAWLPVVLQAQGIDRFTAGTLLAVFNIAGFAPTLLLGLIARRRRVLVGAAFASGLVLAAAMCGLAFGVSSLAFGLVVLIGVSETALFGITMLLLVRNERPGSSILSATSQGVGYVLGALFSASFGGLYAATGSWTLALWLLCGISVALAALAARAVQTSK
jgi:MFS transporter, CP family, cyanate transporter